MANFDYTIIIKGTPIPKSRPRFVRRGDYVGTYKPAQEARLEEDIQKLVKEQLEFQGLTEPIKKCVELSVMFDMPIPQSLKNKVNDGDIHAKKPDIDNLCKFIMDALNGIAWKDDKLVTRLSLQKRYSDVPKTVIWIYDDRR